MKLRLLVPAAFRHFLRRSFDRCFTRAGLTLERVGKTCTWTIMPEQLRPGTLVLSGGAGHDISFELELATRFGCRVAVFDPSPTGQNTFEAVVNPPAGLTFHRLGLSGETKMVSFARPANAVEGSYGLANGVADSVSFECVDPAEALRQAGIGEIELLKIDIEGFEYEFLKRMLVQGIRPKQIAVEFHHFLPHIPLRRTLATVRDLRAAGYVIAHKYQCDILFVHRSVFAG